MPAGQLVKRRSQLDAGVLRPQLAILADDLTGAADAGGCFATAGHATSIFFGDEDIAESTVVVRTTETRDADGDTASQKNRLAVKALDVLDSAERIRWFYKKIDSTLRGFPGEELIAVMEALGETRAVVAPALSVERRTTVGGRQYIDGVRLEVDPALGVDSNLLSIFGKSDAMPVHRMTLDTVRAGTAAIEAFLSEHPSGIVIADAERDDDLGALARAVGRTDLRVLCGSAGFARALSLDLPFTTGASKVVEQRTAESVLVVAGSQHPATIAQVGLLERAGLTIIRPAFDTSSDGVAPCQGAAAEAAAVLRTGRSVVLTSTHLRTIPSGEAFVASCLSEIVASCEVRQRVSALILTGGDVAARVLDRLHARALHLRGEIRPAMPWGVLECELLPGVPVATKAGGFGGDDALLACIEHFRR